MELKCSHKYDKNNETSYHEFALIGCTHPQTRKRKTTLVYNPYGGGVMIRRLCYIINGGKKYPMPTASILYNYM
jgi:hypothetical protein